MDLTLCRLGNFSCVLSSVDFFQNHLFFKISFRNTTIRVSNSLDPVQARYFVKLDLSLNCLQRLSADDTSKQRVKVGVVFGKVNSSSGQSLNNISCYNSGLDIMRSCCHSTFILTMEFYKGIIGK